MSGLPGRIIHVAWLTAAAVAVSCGQPAIPPVAEGAGPSSDGEQLEEAVDGNADTASSDGAGAAEVAADTDGDPDAEEVADTAVAVDKTGKPCDGLRKNGCPCTKGDQECCYYDAPALGLMCLGSRACKKGEDCGAIKAFWSEVWECRCWVYGQPETWPAGCAAEMKKHWCDENYF